MPDRLGEADLTRVVAELRDAVNALRLELVRKDVYEAHRAADKDDVADLRRDLDKTNGRMDAAEADARALRRLALTSFVMPLFVALILLYVTTQVGR